MEAMKEYWLTYFQNEKNKSIWWEKKQKLWKKRDGEIVNIQVRGRKYATWVYESYKSERYVLYLNFLIKQENHYHLEEHVIPRKVLSKKGKVIEHIKVNQSERLVKNTYHFEKDIQHRNNFYNRREAVRYAERWWNDYNPMFRRFTNDCTNYISQCLLAGGALMRGMPNRETGWWYRDENWSFSWSVAHSLRWYLSGSKEGLRGTELATAEELLPGDIICYDFQGDGRWDHTTIVVRHDAYGMPLVNAHTDNSRNRYWSYEDSTAWTPKIQYKFFRIEENMV